MARYMDPGCVKLFRAVITYEYNDGSRATYSCGPFTKRNQASAAITRERRSANRSYWRTVADAYVEATVCTWQVDE